MDKIKPFEKKIWLSSPTMHGDEQKWVNDVFEKNWITTDVEKSNETEILIVGKIGCKYAIAFSIDTGTLHLVIKLAE